MQYYKKIDIDFYDDIVNDAVDYLKTHKPDIYSRTTNTTYHPLDVTEFKKYCTKLDAGFSKYGLTCNWVVVYVMTQNSHSPIHVDGYPQSARINLPLLNCKGSKTVFYSGGEFNKRTFNSKTSIGAWLLSRIAGIRTADSVEIDGPTVVLVNEPHSVLMSEHAPRITLSLGFDKDPVFLLED
jgi:hypothetical protein